MTAPKSRADANQEEIDLMHAGRRIPQKKRSVYRCVFVVLQRAYDAGKINQVTFFEVDKEVRKYFPNSKFNPLHLAHYKHKFLVDAPS